MKVGRSGTCEWARSPVSIGSWWTPTPIAVKNCLRRRSLPRTLSQHMMKKKEEEGWSRREMLLSRVMR